MDDGKARKQIAGEQRKDIRTIRKWENRWRAAKQGTGFCYFSRDHFRPVQEQIRFLLPSAEKRRISDPFFQSVCHVM
ncbi:MAG: hypothetical protein GY795_14015, partial [Desulfobacterales bacterium]|nr:hypothetical protein [Desulfobacterales bacterium]